MKQNTNLLIDCHFHPHLPKNLSKADEKAKKWWQLFEKNNVDAVIVTEHSFRNPGPEETFRIMKKNKPKKPEICKTIILPGAELISRDGLDVIVFSDDEDIYEKLKKLMMPFAFSFEQLISKLIQMKKNNKNNNIHAIIPHPFCLGTSGVVKHRGKEKSISIINQIGAVEVKNFAIHNTVLFLEKARFNKIFRKIFLKLKNDRTVPDDFYNKLNHKKIKFITAGTDAHLFEQIGGGLIVKKDSNKNYFNEKEILNLIISNKQKNFLIPPDNASLGFLIKQSCTSFSEFLLKKRVKLKLVSNKTN